MDLQILHSIMNKNKYHYFEGNTNDKNDLYLSFSTLHNNRGNSVDIRIGDIDNDIICLINNIKTEYKHINNDEVFIILKDVNLSNCAHCGRLFDRNETEAGNKAFCCAACENGY